MDPEMVTRTILLIIAPVVMITSCCILGSGLLAHYSSLGERLHLAARLVIPAEGMDKEES